MEVFIKKIQIGDPPTEYFLVKQSNDDSTKWELNLLCIQQLKAFTSCTSERELRLKAAESPLNTFDVYLSDTLYAFGCRKNGSQEDNPSIHYVLKKKSEKTVLLEWIKDVSGMKVQLGELEFHEKEFDASLREIFSVCLDEMASAKCKIRELSSAVDEKERDRLAIKAVLDETLEMKASLENNLLLKFVKVLNGKKGKIRELYAEKESLERALENSDRYIEEIVSMNLKAKKRIATARSSLTIMNSFLKKSNLACMNLHSLKSKGSTKTAAKPKVEDINKPGPSTRKEKTEDSLLLSDEEVVAKPKMVTRLRKRVHKQSNTDERGNSMSQCVATRCTSPLGRKKGRSDQIGNETNQSAATSSTSPPGRKETFPDTSETIDALFDDL